MTSKPEITPAASVLLNQIVKEMENKGEKICKLHIGEPEIPTHANIKDALYDAVDSDITKYGNTSGLFDLRKKIVESLRLCKFDETQVQICQGAIGALNNIFSSVILPGDEVLCLSPFWPTVESQINKCNGTVKHVDLYDFTVKLDLFERHITPKTTAIYLNNPNNPTGYKLTPAELGRLLSIAQKHDLYLVSDEVYSSFYPSNDKSLLECFKYYKFIYVNSFSKTYAMTGWRLGYCIASDNIIRKINALSSINVTNVPEFVQIAGMKALTDTCVEKYMSTYSKKLEKRIIQINKLLDDNNIEYYRGNYGFYRFIKIPAKISDTEFCKRLLTERGVCVVPGSSYGPSGTGYIRVSVCANEADLMTGIQSIISFISELRRYG